jgi:cytochrome c oxidase assembly factor CtaG
MGTWDPQPLALGAAAVAAMLFARGFLRLRARGRSDHAGAGRALLFAAGLALAVLPLVSPLDEISDRDLLSAHMLEHVLIGDLSPALLVVALRGPLLAFCVPAPVLRTCSRRLGRVLSWLGRPVAAAAAWAVAMAAWHIPGAYDAALARPWLHVLEHATFLGAGLLVWVVLVDPRRSRHVSVAARASLAGAVFLLGQLLCGVLLLSPPLYAPYARQGIRLLGLSPLVDQQYAALLMMAEQLLVLGTFLVLLGASVMRVQKGTRLS